ncbi:MAG: hypothetical protein H6813_00095 [Phycisphaeraceae bacterium]|nr:hypothetical protein [Phycisphaeraceae bacterium]MCB9847514.1 hypothetical protein [Phycisphaeraceae bacterium]
MFQIVPDFPSDRELDSIARFSVGSAIDAGLTGEPVHDSAATTLFGHPPQRRRKGAVLIRQMPERTPELRSWPGITEQFLPAQEHPRSRDNTGTIAGPMKHRVWNTGYLWHHHSFGIMGESEPGLRDGTVV